MPRLLLPLLVATLGICLPGVVRADPPGTAGKGQIGMVIGGGVGLNEVGNVGGAAAMGTTGRVNLYGFGLGPRGGYTFPKVPVYLGGVFMFFLGEREVIDFVDFKFRAGYMLLGIEGGYDFGVGPVIIRPTLWLGPAIGRSKVCGPVTPFGGSADCVGNSDTALLLGPGASVIYAFDQVPLWLGAEMRFTIAAKADHQTGLMFGANIGMLLGD